MAQARRLRIPAWPDMRHERALDASVCGVDEAGYAPLAGPVVAAAVILPPRRPRGLKGLTDSKLLSRAQRERYFDVIAASAAVGVGAASVAEIDRLNIYHANMLAMQRAVADLADYPSAALVDGRAAPGLRCPVRTLIQGDRRSLSIAAASVIAKVTRDRLMMELAPHHPGYGWHTNVGYGTDEHYLGLLRKGPTAHHRRSFAPLTEWFAGHDRPASRYRFSPVTAPAEVDKLTVLLLRQDLRAVFDGLGNHLGLVKNTRSGWVFRSVGYRADGEPALGEGPLAAAHGRPLPVPERATVLELLASL